MSGFGEKRKLVKGLLAAAAVTFGANAGLAMAGSAPSQFVSAGESHSCAVLHGGVQCWGINDDGELGNGAMPESSELPLAVEGLSSNAGVTAVAAGADHSCAVVNGGVRCWGANFYGQLGIGADGPAEPVPVVVPGLSGATTIAAGGSGSHTCAVVSGTARCWGKNFDGELGIGAVSEFEPSPVAPLLQGDVSWVVAGGSHTCAIVNGAVWCWGKNDKGQLGRGSLNGQPQPTPEGVQGLNSVSALAAGSAHTCAVQGGGLLCWGDNSSGQVGIPLCPGGDNLHCSSPVQIQASGSGVTAVAAGALHTCAIVNSGVQCWGINTAGQLGRGTHEGFSVDPEFVTGLSAGSGIIALAAGGDHTCAMNDRGQVRCWGSDDYGEVGDGLSWLVPVPTVSPALAGMSSVAAGLGYSCGVRSGQALCWGLNDSGELGTGATAGFALPQEVEFGNSGIAIDRVVANPINGSSIDANHSCGKTLTGGVYCWGNNLFGQIGVGTQSPPLLTPTSAAVASGATDIAAGGWHSCAVRNGEVLCWGRGDNGELGSGGYLNSSVPVLVKVRVGFNLVTLTGATAISTGAFHSCAVANASVSCWGANGSGQLGDNSTQPSATAILVDGLQGVIAVAAGGAHSCAIAENGMPWCWGANDYGQLGDGTNNPALTPVTVRTGVSDALTGATAIASSAYHSCAVVGGAVYCWGWNGDGQLGTGSFDDSPYAMMVLPSSAAVESVTAGLFHTCASSSTTTWCWGNGYYGALGNGALGYSPVPVLIDYVFRNGMELP